MRRLSLVVVSYLVCLGPYLSSTSTAGTFLRADTHLHLKGCEGNATATDLIQMLIAEDLDIAAGLSWGASWDFGSLSLTGEDSRASVPGHILHYDLEISSFPAGVMATSPC
jgi:hypothetical protein